MLERKWLWVGLGYEMHSPSGRALRQPQLWLLHACATNKTSAYWKNSQKGGHSEG